MEVIFTRLSNLLLVQKFTCKQVHKSVRWRVSKHYRSHFTFLVTPTFFLNSNKNSLFQIIVLSGKNINKRLKSLFTTHVFVQRQVERFRFLSCRFLAFLKVNYPKYSFRAVAEDVFLITNQIVGNEAIDSFFRLFQMAKLGRLKQHVTPVFIFYAYDSLRKR
jgi:hypothetical protein